MSIRKVRKSTTREKRRIRIRKKIRGTSSCPRLTVYRSLEHTYAQLIDDSTGRSIGMVSTNSKSLRSDLEKLEGKTKAAHEVGKEIARLAKDKEIEKVVFDRNGYIFHGRVKAVAEGAREGGLKF